MPALMTAADFKKASSKFMSRRKNPPILDIDNLLALFPQSNGNPRRQLKILVLLYIRTKQYLHQGGSRKGVTELLQQVSDLLDNPAQENWAALSHQGARFKEGAMAAPDSNTGKSMGQGYKMEPLLPGKGEVGGVALNADMKRINTPALRNLFECKAEAEYNKSGAQFTMAQVIKQAEGAMASAPIREFLDIYFMFTQTQAFADRADFEYCNKGDREQYRVCIDHASGRLDQDAAFTKPCTTDMTSLPKDNWAMFAYDLHGRLYCKPASQAPDRSFDHSSFTSGKAVLRAGALESDCAGNLRYISNESGHYRPLPATTGHYRPLPATTGRRRATWATCWRFWPTNTTST